MLAATRTYNHLARTELGQGRTAPGNCQAADLQTRYAVLTRLPLKRRLDEDIPTQHLHALIIGGDEAVTAGVQMIWFATADGILLWTSFAENRNDLHMTPLFRVPP